MTETGLLIELPLEDFIQTPSLGNLEVFLKLSDPTLFPPQPDHFVKLAYRMEDLDRERIRELKYRGVQSVHLNLENLDRYLEFEQKVLRAASHAPMLDPKKKFNLIQTTLNHLIRRIHVANISPADLQFAQEAAMSSIDLLDTLPRGTELIECIEKQPPDLFNHASLTTILALLVAKELKWSTPSVLQKIALAGIFHDHSLKDMPEHFRARSFSELDPKEQNRYMGHAEKSAVALEGFPNIGSEILLAIRQHHERMDGSGFPHGLRARKILPLAMILAISDLFIEDFYRTNDRSVNHAHSVIKNIMYTQKKTLPAPAILALTRVFRLELEEETLHSFMRGGLNLG